MTCNFHTTVPGTYYYQVLPVAGRPDTERVPVFTYCTLLVIQSCCSPDPFFNVQCTSNWFFWFDFLQPKNAQCTSKKCLVRQYQPFGFVKWRHKIIRSVGRKISTKLRYISLVILTYIVRQTKNFGSKTHTEQKMEYFNKKWLDFFLKLNVDKQYSINNIECQ